MHVLVPVLVLILAAPLGAATWADYASLEPNTDHDRLDGYMWADAPDPAGCVERADCRVDRVYFNAWAGEYMAHESPNSATLGSRILPPGRTTFVAELGVWVDCNHDGYVGLADGALQEYRVEAASAAGVPVDVRLCPPMADAPENLGIVRNGGGWITEMLPLGPYDPELGNFDFTVRNQSAGADIRDYRQVPDNASKVWADHLAPATSAARPTACGTYFARGEASHTGGVLAHLDCMTGFALATHAPGAAALYADGGPADTNTGGDPQDCKDAPDGSPPGPGACTWGSNSYVYGMRACENPPLTEVEGLPVGDPRNAQANPDGNLAATFNETLYTALFECDTTGYSLGDPYWPVERDQSATSLAGRDHADLRLDFAPNARLHCDDATNLFCGMPYTFGAPQTTPYFYDAMWSASMPDPAPAPEPSSVWTFYAHVEAPGYALPKGASGGVYGAEWCTDGIQEGAPAQNGWICDPSLWNLDGATGKPFDDAAMRGTVGDTYQLRDVDCYDGTILAADSTLNPTHADVGAGLCA